MRKILLAFLLTTTMFSVSAKAGLTLGCDNVDANGCLIQQTSFGVGKIRRMRENSYKTVYKQADTNNDGCITVDECKAYNAKQK